MTPIQLGLRANARQFALLVGLNALVGGMVGLERSVLPLVGRQDFGLRSSAAILSFVVAFGVAKALTNLAAGELAERLGRKRLLVLGWLVALPVPLLIGLAPSWWFIVAANLLLGANQGLAWSMTVVMKIDLAGPRHRGLALGLNEAAGYLGVAAAAFATGALAANYSPRTVASLNAPPRRRPSVEPLPRVACSCVTCAPVSRIATMLISRPTVAIAAAPTQTMVRGAKLAASAPVANAVAATPR
jgi:MFS family permease